MKAPLRFKINQNNVRNILKNCYSIEKVAYAIKIQSREHSNVSSRSITSSVKNLKVVRCLYTRQGVEGRNVPQERPGTVWTVIKNSLTVTESRSLTVSLLLPCHNKDDDLKIPKVSDLYEEV